MRIGIFPGSFDPLTFGHIDIIKRAKNVCDKLIIAIAKNSTKNALFSLQERQEMITACFKDITGFYEIVFFDALVAEYCKENGVNMIIRGLRSTVDYEYEKSIVGLNNRLAPGIETVFLFSSEETEFISSRMVKEVASYHGDISSMVPKLISDRILQKYSNR